MINIVFIGTIGTNVSFILKKLKKVYSNNKNIILYDKTFTYNSVLREFKSNNFNNFINNKLSLKNTKIDLMIFFDINSKKHKQTKDIIIDKKMFLKFNYELKDFIRYNNSEYNLFVIKNNDSIEKTIKVISNKIDEVVNNSLFNDKWFKLYENDILKYKNPDNYIKHKLKCKKIFVNIIKKYAKNRNVIEMGCGTGVIAGYLQKVGLNVTAVDINHAILAYAKEIANQSNIISPCKYILGDILNFENQNELYDVSYSNGVLEHFNDKEIVTILKKQLNISRYVIFGVPSTYFRVDDKMYGNERRLTLEEWKKLIDNANGKIIEQTGFHYYKFYKRLFDIKGWFKPKEFWLFILENKY